MFSCSLKIPEAHSSLTPGYQAQLSPLYILGWDQEALKFRRSSHSRGDGRILGLGLEAVKTLSRHWEKKNSSLCSLGPCPCPAILSPSQVDLQLVNTGASPRIQGSWNSQAQDCWPKVFTSSLPNNKLQGVAHSDKLTTAPWFSYPLSMRVRSSSLQVEPGSIALQSMQRHVQHPGSSIRWPHAHELWVLLLH